MEEYEEVESNKQKSGYCAPCCLLFAYATLTGATLLSVACSWGYSKNYDASEANVSQVAAILTSIALCGCTFGICGICTGGSQASTGLKYLMECFNTCDENNEICMCCRLLAICGMAIIIVPSFGILQVINKNKC